MELVEIKIKRFKEPVTGILLGNGTQWSLVKLNVVDYVLDGFQFTNKRYVASNCPIKEDTLQYRILAIKNSSKDISSKIDLNILEEDKLLYSFLKNSNILVAICLHREDVLYVGKIKGVNTNNKITDIHNAFELALKYILKNLI